MSSTFHDLAIGDANIALDQIAPKRFQTVVTSPPYWGLRDYGVNGQMGLEDTPDQFITDMVALFSKVKRVLRDDGTLWLNIGDKYVNNQLLGMPWKLALAMQQDGWLLRSDIIWHKPNPVPEPDRKRPTLAHEYLFLFTKNKSYFYDTHAIREQSSDKKIIDNLTPNTGADADRLGKGYKKKSTPSTHPAGRNKHSVGEIPTFPCPDSHFATFPPKLVEPCILAGTSEKGCCSECGAPYTRVTEATEEYKKRLRAHNKGKGWHDHTDDLVKGQRGTPPAFRGGLAFKTIGWQQGCDCTADVVPCMVLDPFAGTGTTAKMAQKLGRNSVSIELNPDYAKLITKNLSQQTLAWGTAI